MNYKVVVCYQPVTETVKQTVEYFDSFPFYIKIVAKLAWNADKNDIVWIMKQLW